MLSRARLGDHARLAHVTRDQRLPDRVVDLVRAGMVQILALEVDLRAAQMLGPAAGVVDGARASDEMLQLAPQLGIERPVRTAALVGRAQLVQGMDQGFGDEHAAIRPEMTSRIRQARLHFGPLE